MGVAVKPCATDSGNRKGGWRSHRRNAEAMCLESWRKEVGRRFARGVDCNWGLLEKVMRRDLSRHYVLVVD